MNKQKATAAVDNELESITRLIDAHNELTESIREFGETTGCDVCYQSYIQLGGNRDNGRLCRELATFLGKTITISDHNDKHSHHSFVYQDVTILWLEEK